jgi:hypothetical protein
MTKDTLFMNGTYQFLWLSSLCFLSYFIAFIYTYDPDADPDEQALANREKRIEEERIKEEEEARAEELAKKGDPRAAALEEAKQLLDELKKRHNKK